MIRSSHSTTACIVLSLVAWLWSTQVQAHARLISSEPAAGATLLAPKVIRLEFSEAIARAFSSFTLTRADSSTVALKAVTSQDSKALVAMPAIALGPGVYTVSWTAVSSDDGHKTSGHFNFTVR